MTTVITVRKQDNCKGRAVAEGQEPVSVTLILFELSLLLVQYCSSCYMTPKLRFISHAGQMSFFLSLSLLFLRLWDRVNTQLEHCPPTPFTGWANLNENSKMMKDGPYL